MLPPDLDPLAGLADVGPCDHGTIKGLRRGTPPAAPAPMSWAWLLKRRFAIDSSQWPLDNHRRHPRPYRDRRDPRASWLAHPGTASRSA